MSAAALRAVPDVPRRSLDAVLSADTFEIFFDAVPVGLAVADLQGRYVRVNAAYAGLLGRDPEDFVGLEVGELTHAADVADERERRDLLLQSGAERLTAEKRQLRGDGSVVWVLHGMTLVRGSDGEPAWFALSAQDITARRTAEDDLRRMSDRLAHRALHDPLTGLPNRELLFDRARLALARSARSGGRVGVLFADLDRFKAVNDSFGHRAGDHVLQEVARRLAHAVRPSDTVARLGGDEFVVLVDPVDDEADLASLRARLLHVLAEPLDWRGEPLPVGASVGLSLSTRADRDPAALVARADAAMYAEKHRATG